MLLLENVDVVILCGGYGTRARPVLGTTPKILAPVHGRTMLDLHLSRFIGLGANRIILALGNGFEKVICYVNDMPKITSEKIAYVVDYPPTGVGNAVKHVSGYVKSGYALVINGDTWVKVDIENFISFSKAVGGRNVVCTFDDKGTIFAGMAFVPRVKTEFGEFDNRNGANQYWNENVSYLDIGSPEGYAKAEEFIPYLR